MLCMKPFLRIEHVWQDADIDMLEINVAAESALFADATNVYYTYDAMRRFAGSLENFSRSRSDKQGFDTGETQASAFVALSLFCRDFAGHIGVTVKIRNEAESVQLEFTSEAAAIDRFRTALLELCSREAGTAKLEGASA